MLIELEVHRCIDNFKSIRDVNGKTAKEINKEWEIQQRKKALNDKYNGIIEKIDNWNKKIDEIPTIINGYLEDEYDKLYSQVQDLYSKFIKYVFLRKLSETELNNLKKYIINNGEKISKEDYNNRIATREKAEKAMQVDYSKFI